MTSRSRLNPDIARARPRLDKRLGQHHLRDSRLCGPLVRWLLGSEQDAGRGTTVLEIGPGGGVLTRALLDAGARVLAVELDLAWAAYLARHQRRGPGAGPLAIVALDILRLDPRRLPAGALVAGNLPFGVGTAILGRFLPHHERVARMAVMVQKEVAERLVAGPGDAAYGALSVWVAAYADACLLGTVKPGSFEPPPKVAAAFVGLRPKPPPLPAAAMPALERIIRSAFGQRRKTLRNSLGARWGKHRAQALLMAAGIDPARRAETLDLGDFLRLHTAAQGPAPRV